MLKYQLKLEKEDERINKFLGDETNFRRRSNSISALDAQSDKSINDDNDKIKVKSKESRISPKNQKNGVFPKNGSNSSSLKTSPSSLQKQKNNSPEQEKLQKDDRKRRQTFRFIVESDKKLSRKLITTNVIPVSSSILYFYKGTKSIDEEKTNNSASNIDEFSDFIKNRRTTIMPLARKKSNLKFDKKEKIIFPGIEEKKEEEEHEDLKMIFNKSVDDIEIRRKSVKSVKGKTSKTLSSNLKEHFDGDDNDFDRMEEVFHKPQDVSRIDPYFGELFEDQEERLKKISPFGGLNTWKTFKMIGIYNNKISKKRRRFETGTICNPTYQ